MTNEAKQAIKQDLLNGIIKAVKDAGYTFDSVKSEWHSSINPSTTEFPYHYFREDIDWRADQLLESHLWLSPIEIEKVCYEIVLLNWESFEREVIKRAKIELSAKD